MRIEFTTRKQTNTNGGILPVNLNTSMLSVQGIHDYETKHTCDISRALAQHYRKNPWCALTASVRNILRTNGANWLYFDVFYDSRNSVRSPPLWWFLAWLAIRA